MRYAEHLLITNMFIRVYMYLRVYPLDRNIALTFTLVPMSAGIAQSIANSQIDTAIAMVIRVARLPPPAMKQNKHTLTYMFI